MSRLLSLGNGQILVNLDHRAQVRDFYFPYVGLENHVGLDRVHRIGVWVDGKLQWLSDPSWNIRIDCGGDALMGYITAKNTGLGVLLEIRDVVYNEKNIFVRQITLHNLEQRKRKFKIFFSQEFQIAEVPRGDTAYFDPNASSIIHYKGKRVFLINACINGKKSFDDFSVGLARVEGKEGTFVDAEDGLLEKNPIEHGPVDSVIGLSLELAGKASTTLHYWIAVAQSIKAVYELNRFILEKTPQHLMQTSNDFWRAWVNKQGFSFYGLNESIVELFKKSLFIIRSHIDNGGAIIASGDSDMLQHGRDTYSYMWPRDGALSALALEQAGDFNVARRFFEFSNSVITDEGYFMHKYRPDGSLGSSWHPWIRNGKVELPIQEDETALVLYSLWRYYELSRNLEFIESVYNSLIKKSGDFLVSYTYKDTGLPYPSYDLWEEKYGIATFSCGAKYGALIAAEKFARLLGKEESAECYGQAAARVKKAIVTHLYNEDRGMFYKLASQAQSGKMEYYDTTLDMSSIYGIYKFNVLPIDDPRVTRSIKTVEEQLMLSSDTTIGGMPRYENDVYYKENKDAPSNPWFVTTLWLAQYYIRAAKKESDLDRVKTLLQWVVSHALPSGVLSEQLHPYTGMQLSAAPLTWSHAEFVITVTEYLEKLEELGICKACNPVSTKLYTKVM